MLSTRQAAEFLRITPRRVISLIESGELVASRFGRAWMIDERSVEARQQMPKLKGRPKMGQKRLMNLKRYTLMNRNHEVLDFIYDSEKRAVSIEKLHIDAAWAPLGIYAQGQKPNNIDLAQWLARRYMPSLRPEAATLMRIAGVSSTDALMFGSLGLNLSDQYWFRPEGTQLDWHDLNFFENGYAQSSGQRLRTPDSSTPGALEKRWERIDGVDVLLKGSSGSDQREPYSEVLATELMSRLLIEGEYVSYTIIEKEGRVCSACPTFVSADEEFISANDVAVYAGITEGRDLYKGYAEFSERAGIDGVRASLSKMIVCDHIMANFDRHRGNFGLMRTVENLENWKIAPLFDHGAGFYSRATLNELKRDRFTWIANPFEEYPSQQLARVEDMSWYDPQMVEGFCVQIQETLSLNQMLSAAFVEHTARHVQRQIDAVNDLAAERSAVYAGF